MRYTSTEGEQKQRPEGAELAAITRRGGVYTTGSGAHCPQMTPDANSNSEIARLSSGSSTDTAGEVQLPLPRTRYETPDATSSPSGSWDSTDTSQSSDRKVRPSSWLNVKLAGKVPTSSIPISSMSNVIPSNGSS